MESNRTNLLKQLVDPDDKVARLDKLPQHKKHWQLLQRVPCLYRDDDPSIVLPIIGGDGQYYEKHFAQTREDTTSFDGTRLQQLLNKGWLWSSTEKVTFYHPSGSKFKWRLLSETDRPHDLEKYFIPAPVGSPWRPPWASPSSRAEGSSSSPRGDSGACLVPAGPRALAREHCLLFDQIPPP